MSFFRFFTACCVMMCFSVYAQEDATAGLYVCQGQDGVKNIVNKPTGDNCVPYRKGILTGESPNNTSHNARPLPPAASGSASNLVAPEKGIKESKETKETFARPLPAAASGSASNLIAPAKGIKESKETKETFARPLPPATSGSASHSAAPSVLFPPASDFTGTGSGELYRLLGISKPEPIIPSKTAAGKQIWMCLQANGTPMVVESETPLHNNCQPIGRSASAAKNATPINRGKPLVGSTAPAGEKTTSGEKAAPADGSIAVTTSPPQDIYKCIDDKGKANYVGENQKDRFKECEFFSRSFAQVHAEFIQQATRQKTLASLAAAGVQQGKAVNQGSVIGLQCIGAGTVEFNGQSRKFNCATRSFDYTPGTSGGNVRLGEKQADIAAHNLNYLNDKGSCGGEVTSENGRVFHLEPTKDCPQRFIVQAEKIRVQVEKHLNINTSGAFRQRQQALAAQINQIAGEVGVDPFLVHAVISAESAYKTRARSHAGARGLMQLMPATARRFGVSDSYHTGQNIRGGSTYLKYLLKLFKGNMELAIAAYNAGEGNVRKYGNRIPPFIETRAYVPKVLQYYRRYRSHPSEVGL